MSWCAVLAYSLWTVLPHGFLIRHQHEEGHGHSHTQETRHTLKLKNQIQGLTFGHLSGLEGPREEVAVQASHAAHAPFDFSGIVLRPANTVEHEHAINPAFAGEASLASLPHSVSFHSRVLRFSNPVPESRRIASRASQARAPPAV